MNAPPDEVDASRVKRMLVCAEYKAPSWIKYPRRFLFSTIFVLVNFIHVVYIIVKKVRMGEKNVYENYDYKCLKLKD